MPNAYESGAQKIVPAVLLYARFGEKMLMLHRNSSPTDVHAGKWNGLGGKLEAGETFKQAAVREFLEESACETKIEQWHWAGQLFFPQFKAQKNEDWWVTVYTANLQADQVHLISVQEPMTPEGSLHWIQCSEILSLNLWEGDRKFIPLVLSHQCFEGTFFYQEGNLIRHELELIRSIQ